MKVKNIGLALGLASLSSVLVSTNAQAVTFTAWNFENIANNTVTATPAPSTNLTGTGYATDLGMTNSYTYTNGEGPGSSSSSNITTEAGSSSGSSSSNQVWRIVGNSNTTNSGAGKANGWNSAAPEYTQGAEFTTSTAGYSNIILTFDWIPTTQGVNDIAVLYNTNTSNSSGWTFAYLSTNSTSGGGWNNGITVNLSALSANVNNDPNFGVELVSAFDPSTSGYTATTPGTVVTFTTLSGSGSGSYLSASNAPLNNSSGNVRFDNVAFSGTPVPFDFDPAYGVVLGLPLFMGMRIVKKRL